MGLCRIGAKAYRKGGFADAALAVHYRHNGRVGRPAIPAAPWPNSSPLSGLPCRSSSVIYQRQAALLIAGPGARARLRESGSIGENLGPGCRIGVSAFVGKVSGSHLGCP